MCAGRNVPKKVRHQKPFTAFAVDGTLDFGQTGVLVALLTPLATDEISAFTLSTFDTDWILVRADAADGGEQGPRVQVVVAVTQGGPLVAYVPTRNLVRFATFDPELPTYPMWDNRLERFMASAGRSLMLSAGQLGLSAQQIADIAAYLK